MTLNKTEIYGYFDITPELTDYDKFYLLNFTKTKHIKRDPLILSDIYENRNGYNGFYGEDGKYFINYVVNSNGKSFGNYHNNINDNKSIIDDKVPPSKLPNIYCPWVMDDNRLIPLRSNKHNRHFSWLRWLINEFFDNHTLNKFRNNKKYKLNGRIMLLSTVSIRTIEVKDNVINYKWEPKNSTNNDDKFNFHIVPNKKNDKEIINDLIQLTKTNKIKWGVYEINSPFVDRKYFTNIKYDGGITIFFSFLVKSKDNDVLYIYINKNKKSKKIKEIEFKGKFNSEELENEIIK